jgi:hypothetical protein
MRRSDVDVGVLSLLDADDVGAQSSMRTTPKLDGDDVGARATTLMPQSNKCAEEGLRGEVPTLGKREPPGREGGEPARCSKRSSVINAAQHDSKLHQWLDPRWRGVACWKLPLDAVEVGLVTVS